MSTKMNQSMVEALQNAAKIMGKDATEIADKYAETVENHWKKTNAVTDIMSTGNVGYGAEAVIPQTRTDEVYSMISQLPGLMPKLPANHGQLQGSTVSVDVIGEVELFKTATESTGPFTYASLTTDNAVATGKVDIAVKGFSSTFAVSKKALHNAIGGSDRFYQAIQNRILLGAQRTLEAYVLNADPRTTDTPVGIANVNFFDTAGTETIPANAYYLGGNHGIRSEGIFNGIVGGNVAFNRALILEGMDMVSDYLDDSARMLWIMSGKGAVKARGLSQYSTQDVFGPQATNTQGGRLLTLEGIDTYTAKDMPGSVGVSGKVEVSGTANNAYGTISLLHRFAPQYCFGHDMQIVVKETAKDILFDVWMEFGCAIVDEKAGLGKTVAQLVFQN